MLTGNSSIGDSISACAFARPPAVFLHLESGQLPRITVSTRRVDDRLRSPITSDWLILQAPFIVAYLIDFGRSATPAAQPALDAGDAAEFIHLLALETQCAGAPSSREARVGGRTNERGHPTGDLE